MWLFADNALPGFANFCCPFEFVDETKATGNMKASKNDCAETQPSDVLCFARRHAEREQATYNLATLQMQPECNSRLRFFCFSTGGGTSGAALVVDATVSGICSGSDEEQLSASGRSSSSVKSSTGGGSSAGGGGGRCSLQLAAAPMRMAMLLFTRKIFVDRILPFQL